MPEDPRTLTEDVKAVAARLGADLMGVAEIRSYPGYLEEATSRIRETGATAREFMLPEAPDKFFAGLADVAHTHPWAHALVLLGVCSRDTEGDYRTTTCDLKGKTARTYAYYPVVRQIAEEVAAYIANAGHRAIHGQQVPLKYAAHMMGLGSYGWNGLLYTNAHGSYIALRAVITSAVLEPDQFDAPAVACETCGRCLHACPTGALYAPYKVDPARCINPLTRRDCDISHRLRVAMGNWVCGCDICQEVCPMNRDLKPRAPDPRAGFDPSHHSSHALLGGLPRCPDLAQLLGNDRMPVMQRNAAIALAHIGSEEALRILERHRDCGNEELEKCVAWAVTRIRDTRPPPTCAPPSTP